MKKDTLLGLLIFAGLILGAIVGAFIQDPNWSPTQPEDAHRYGSLLYVFHILGNTVFLGLLKMLIIPLIAVSVIAGITSIDSAGKLGRLGLMTIVFYTVTMLLAISVGLILVNIFTPGADFPGASLAAADTSALPEFTKARGVAENLINQLVPGNIFEELASGAPLPVIVFSIFFAVILVKMGEKTSELKRIFRSLFDVFMELVNVILWLAPIGVFALLARTVAMTGVSVFGETLGLYMMVVLLGLFVHAVVILPLLIFLFTGENPFKFAHQMRDAIMTALATSSSTATLPVTIECATEQAKISPRVAGLVIPLGSTINMDGTALYEAVAVVFLAQAFGVELHGLQMLIIALTATLAAVGAAGIPSAGLVTMAVVIEAVNQSLLAADPASATIPIAGIALIVGVDRVLDMFRTAVNVWGDAAGAKIIGARELS